MVKEHKTVSLFNPFIDKDEEIDENIAELIDCLWKLDIETINSCENNIPTGYIWIEFLCGYDAERFLDIVGKYIYKDKADVYKEDGLYQRMKINPDESPNQWLYNCELIDFSEKVINDYIVMEHKFCGFALPISVRFPIKDYPVVLKSLKKELKKE